MSFYCIYIDEYGDTGFNLEDPQQPLFLMQAALVPTEEGRWQSVENEILNTISEVSGLLKNKTIDRLHMYDMVQMRSPFDLTDYPTVFRWIERVLDAAKSNETKYVSIPLPKYFLGTRKVNGIDGIYFNNLTTIESDDIADKEIKSGTFPFSPYQFAFQFLLGSVEQVLEQLDGHGILIIDQKRQEEVLAKLNTYRVLRSANILTRIIENPIFRDSRENAMLTVPDFTAYILGRSVSDEILNKNSPEKIMEWKEKYIIPQTVAYFPEFDSVWEIDGFEFFKSRLQQLLKGEGPPLMSLQACILLLMFHEMAVGGDLRKYMSIGRALKLFYGKYLS